VSLSIQALVDYTRASLNLRVIGGEAGLNREIVPDENQGLDAADLVGYLNLIHPGRVNIIGPAELVYFSKQDPQRRSNTLREIIAGMPPAIIACDDLSLPADLLEALNKGGITTLATSYSAARVIETVRSAVAKTVAPRCERHGVFMDVLGMGVLISGESGLGKSELALELISRGHGLVADDVVEFTRLSPTAIEGRCPALLQNMLEVRGLGLLDIKAIFGETSVRRKMRVRLIVQLIRRSAMENEYERLPLEALKENILGVDVRKVVIPVAAGRNIAVLTEAAVRSTVLQLRGIDAMGEFIARQRHAIDAQSPIDSTPS
jgi:HPr kinase/phosphorylase